MTSASRFTTPEAFVVAESYVRRSADYRAARDAALSHTNYRNGCFEVALPIEDALGRELVAAVEGVVRVEPRSAPQGVTAMKFDGGLVIARFRIAADGEPRPITMFPIGRRE